MASTLRLADLMAGLSMIADLGFGLPPQEAMRTCVLSTLLARRMDLPEATVRDCFYAALLMHIGCISMSHESTAVWGDDIRVTAAVAKINVADPRDFGKLAAELGVSGLWGKTSFLVKAAVRGSGFAKMYDSASCEVARETARRLGLPPSTQRALYQVAEWWQGGGAPDGLKGDDIDIAARIVHAAGDAAFFDDIGDAETAVTAMKRRVGLLDPEVVEVFTSNSDELLAELNAGDPRVLLLQMEPKPVMTVSPGRLPDVAAAFGDTADLKTPFLHGHSARVAQLTAAAATALRIDAAATARLHVAALLHDVGRVAISDTIWEKPAALTFTEWEQVRLHAYHSERILAASEALRPLASLVGLHHERLDGSGYHRGALARDVGPEARLLAAADAFIGMTSDRPHRAALPGEKAAAVLSDEASAGQLDGDVVRAVVAAAGEAVHTRSAERPAGLTGREIEVLRLVSEGCSNPQIAAALHISRRTAEHHVQNIYTKIGLSTRTGAALFALEHDLLGGNR